MFIDANIHFLISYVAYIALNVLILRGIVFFTCYVCIATVYQMASVHWGPGRGALFSLRARGGNSRVECIPCTQFHTINSMTPPFEHCFKSCVDCNYAKRKACAQ